MKTLELTDEACKLIADALSDKIAMWSEHNVIIQKHGTNKVVDKYVKKNKEKIMKLVTLLNYIDN